MPHDEFKCAVAIAALQNESRDLRAKLAEREAQIGALRECATRVLHQVRAALTPDLRGPILSNALGQLDDAVDDAAASARAFVERIQATERERVAQMIEETRASDDMFMGRNTIAAAIRALGEK